MSALPSVVSAALETKLQGVSRNDLRARAQRISASYRGGGGSGGIRSDLDALAYAVVRMPATYAALRAALAQASRVIPDFAPQTVLDIGAGPGTATWAACGAWPSLERATLIDGNAHLLALADALRPPSLAVTTLQSLFAAALAETPGADIVMASYVLAEMPGAGLPAVGPRINGGSGWN